MGAREKCDALLTLVTLHLNGPFEAIGAPFLFGDRVVRCGNQIRAIRLVNLLWADPISTNIRWCPLDRPVLALVVDHDARVQIGDRVRGGEEQAFVKRAFPADLLESLAQLDALDVREGPVGERIAFLVELDVLQYLLLPIDLVHRTHHLDASLLHSFDVDV